MFHIPPFRSVCYFRLQASLREHGMNQYVHPVWEAELIHLIKESEGGLKLKSRIYLKRMRVQEQKGLSSFWLKREKRVGERQKKSCYKC